MAARPGNTVGAAVVTIEGSKRTTRSDRLATEEPMELRVGVRDGAGWKLRSVAVTMRTPGNDFELAAGFAFTEGIVASREDIDSIAYCTDPDEPQNYNIVNVYLSGAPKFDIDKLSRHVYTSSSCGVCGKGSIDLVRAVCPTRPVGESGLSSEVLSKLPGALSKGQALFSQTGGIHAAALFDSTGELLFIREDVGRHNAMDKVVGALLMQGKLPASNTVAFVSGRSSFELVQKASMAGIPALVSVGAPSSLAVDLATEFGMTLIGFLRENRFNVYAGSQRVEPSPAQ